MPETKINIRFFAVTSGTDLFLTFLVVLLAFGSWKKDMIDGNLQGCNTMTSGMDFMACATSIAYGDGDSEAP